MYAMTLLTVAQATKLDNLFHARMDEQLARGHVLSGEGAALTDLIRLPRHDIRMRPVGLWREDALVAAFALQDGTPLDGWTDEERAEASLLVLAAHAHPRYRGLGVLITRWLCDYAARRPSPPDWIRCTVRTPEVARHLERTCGWQPVRELRGWDRPRHLLQLAPRRDEHLHTLIRTEQSGSLSYAAQGGVE